MNALKFNDKFDDIIEEPMNYWKTLDDVPQNIKEFIRETSNSIPIYDESNNKYYCPKCIEEITNQNKCPKCFRTFKSHDNFKIENINDIRALSNDVYYYIFDINDNDILLYLLWEYVDYRNPMAYFPYKNSKISIKNIYQILPTKIINVTTNKQILYKELENILTRFTNSNNKISTADFNLLDEFEFNKYEHQYLYTNNLIDLKNTSLYKYSNIWILKDYLKENYFNLSSLTFYPVYYKEFEYLLKMKLFELAIACSSSIKYKGTFKDTFGVDKKYYQFMKNINITGPQLEALKLYQTTDINTLNFIKDNLWLAESILKYVNLDKALEYLKKQDLNMNNLHEYGDYIRCCEEMKLNLKDHNVLFPKYFIKEHDKVTNEMLVSKDPLIDKRIKELADFLILNKYEDDKYIIFPADSIKSLIDESSQQSNCVRTYCEMVSNNECQIYFMRYKTDVKKSFVTIEVRNNKVVQAKARFNEEPPTEVMNIISKWEKMLISLSSK
mgnify:FL=1